MTLSIEDILTQAKPPESVVTLCLRGDLVAEYEDLERRLDSASETVESLGDVSPAAEIRARMVDLARDMVSGSVTFRLRAMTAKAWSDLFARQPDMPKPDDEGKVADADADVYRAGMFDWFRLVVAATCCEPEMTPEQAGELADVLSHVQWDELATAAWNLNTGKQTIPFSVAAFASPPATTPKSKRPTNSASHGRSSSAGS